MKLCGIVERGVTGDKFKELKPPLSTVHPLLPAWESEGEFSAAAPVPSLPAAMLPL